MRLPLLKRDQLSDQRKPRYGDMQRGISSNFNAFVAVDADGSLMGPWNPWLPSPGSAARSGR